MHNNNLNQTLYWSLSRPLIRVKIMNKTTLDKSQSQLVSMEQTNEIYKEAESKNEQNGKKMIKCPMNECVMSQCLINEVVFTGLAKNVLQAKLIEQLTGTFNLQIQEFGYRQFLSNGTTMGFCTRNFCTKNFDNSHNIQNKNLSYQSLIQFYSQQACNSFVIYQRTKDKIEGFYFLPSTNSPEIISYYLSHFESFEQFISLVSLCVSLVLGSIRCSNSYCQNLHNNNLYVKIFSPNNLAELFPEKVLNN
ncbi:hypothetical protein [Candidatus Tisiphia endosymbiont of Thecophora atra]|uniref:hypothetical protein n=1 Tax=Candidatus Tisiphia endosymbiont of Thecophora atra TaxID=3066258 RepID=UPI00312CB7B0